MIIGYDAKRAVSNTTGLGSYSRNLINAVSGLLNNNDKLVLYTPKEGNAHLIAQINTNANVKIATPQGWLNKQFSGLWRISGLTKTLVNDKIEVFHGLSGELPTGISATPIVSVVTIHDLIFLRHPEFYHPIDVQIYKWKFYNACKQADKIIAISERTKQDILHYSSIDPSKIAVIYQPCAPNFSTQCSPNLLEEIQKRYALPQRFILNVGTIEARKNMLLVIKALEKLPSDVHLVMVGRNTPYTKDIIKYASQQGLMPRIHIFNKITNQELPAFYKLAQCFVYPSLYEGFGLPIVEAIQCGCAVVACTGSCLEEAGGDACLYVHPNDVLGMANALLHWINNPEEKAKSIAISKEYIKRFENNNMAQQMQQLYNEVFMQKKQTTNH